MKTSVWGKLTLILVALVLAFGAFMVRPATDVSANTTYTKTCYATVYYGGVKRAAFQQKLTWESRTYLGVKQSRLTGAVDSITYQQSGWALSSKSTSRPGIGTWYNAIGPSYLFTTSYLSYKVTRTSDGFSPGRYWSAGKMYWSGTISCSSYW